MGFRVHPAQAIGSNGAFRCFFEEQKVCHVEHAFLLDYLLPRLFGLHVRRAGGAQALSVAEFKALAYSKGHREPCAKRAPPRWALQCRPKSRQRCPLPQQ